MKFQQLQNQKPQSGADEVILHICVEFQWLLFDFTMTDDVILMEVKPESGQMKTFIAL